MLFSRRELSRHRNETGDFKPSVTERSEVKRGLKSKVECRPEAQFQAAIDTSNTELQTSVANDAFLYFTGPLKLDRDSRSNEPAKQSLSQSHFEPGSICAVRSGAAASDASLLL